MSTTFKSNNPTSYLGVEPTNPPQVWCRKRDPINATDVKNYTIGDVWINTVSHAIWMLSALVNTPGNPSHKTAVWAPVSNIGPAGIATLIGDAGVVVGPTLGNCNIIGDGVSIATTGVAPSDIRIGLTGNPSFRWIPAATPQFMVENTGYMCITGGPHAFSLPPVAAVGSVFAIQGFLGSWGILPGAGQVIFFSQTSFSSAGGGCISTDPVDAISLICVVANTLWAVNNIKGNITVI